MKFNKLKFVCAFIFLCISAGGAFGAGLPGNQNPYQFDDVAGYPSGSGIGAQWLGISGTTTAPANLTNSIGASADAAMRVEGDLVSRNNPLTLPDANIKINNVSADQLGAAFLVIREGSNSFQVNFKYTGASSQATTLGISAANFGSAYSITPSQTPLPVGTNVTLTVSKLLGTANVYNSTLGELIFHQNPTNTASQSTHVPFVIANVHNGDARGAPLDIKITTRNTANDIVARRWFNWTVEENFPVQSNPIDWIFVPLESEDIDTNNIIYPFMTEVTNHSGLRYAVQRYDGTSYQSLAAARWKFDLHPIDKQLPQTISLDPLSHIAPGLVTIYSHDAKITTGRQELLQLAAVDPTRYPALGSKKLTLDQRTIFGYRLDNANSPNWALTAFKVYPSAYDFFTRALTAMDMKSSSSTFPDRAGNVGGIIGNPSYSFITADALSSFTMSASTGGNSMLGLNVTLRIPRGNRFITPLWDAFAASQSLTHDFARYFSIWFRSPAGDDLELSKFLFQEGKYEKIIKVFLDEENNWVTVNYILLLVEGGDAVRRPRIRIVSDTTTVNDYDYIVVNDGLNNGYWDMTFFVAPSTDYFNEVKSAAGGGGGCSAGIFPNAMWFPLLLLIPLLLAERVKNVPLVGKIFATLKTAIKCLFALALTLLIASSSHAATPAFVSYDIDLAGTPNSLRWAINEVNNGITDTIVFDNLHTINLDPALGQIALTGHVAFSNKVTIEGNGTMISNSAANRLFEIQGGANVTFRAISFANGAAGAGDGGAVLVTNGTATFDKCTFNNNTATNGGAVYVPAVSTANFINCTFYSNNATTNGGAVAGTATSTLNFSFVTMNNNTATGNGQAVNALGTNTFLGSVFVGNGGGNDVVVGGGSANISHGYNMVGNSSLPWGYNPNDMTNITDSIFASTTPGRNQAAPGWNNWPYTIMLQNISTNPAIGMVPDTVLSANGILTDQRYILRAQGSSKMGSTGAYEVFQKDPFIADFKIGGMPNGIATEGFSVLLAQSIIPQDANPESLWVSSNPSVVSTTAYGRIYSREKGTALLTATSAGYDKDGNRRIITIPIIVQYTAAQNPGYTLSDPNVSQTAQAATSSGGSSGGGGGCDAGIFGGALLLLAGGLLGIKLRKFLFILVILVSFAFSAEGSTTFNIEIVNNPSFLTVGGIFTLRTDLVSPDDYKYSWSESSNGNFALIPAGDKQKKDPTITGISLGQVIISCDVENKNDSNDKKEGNLTIDVVYGFESISLKPLVLNIKNSATISLDIQPAQVIPYGVVWISSSSTIVALSGETDKSAIVFANAKGTAQITYSANMVKKLSGKIESVDVKCDVIVVQPVISMDITPNATTTKKGFFTSVAAGTQPLTLTVVTYPPGADSTDIVWKFENATVSPSIATLTPAQDTKTALFKAVSFPGQNVSPLANLPITYNVNTKNPIRVVATLKDWGAGVANIWTDSCDVIINPIEIGGVTISPANAVLSGTQTSVDLTAIVTPPNATMTSADWSSSNSAAIYVTTSTSALTNKAIGRLVGQANVGYTFLGWKISADQTHTPFFATGLSFITYPSPDPKIEVVLVNIIDPPIGNTTMPVGQSRQFVAQVSPYNATSKDLTWASSNPIAATVSGNGFVTAHYPGTTTITASSDVKPTIFDWRAVTVTSSPSVITNPSTVTMAQAIEGSITNANVPLQAKGCEVNFGFTTTNKPTTLGGAIITNITTAPEIKEAAQPQISGVIGSAGKFELAVPNGSYVPVSLKFTITEQDIFRYIGGDTSYIRAIIADPRAHLATLFGAFSIQKQIIDPPNTATKMIPLITNPTSAQTAANAGILFLEGKVNKIEVTLNYYVGDSANTTAAFIEGNLVVGDGAANGVIRDPVWVVATKPPVNTGSASSSSSGGGGGGGCNAVGVLGIAVLLAIVPFVMRRR